ncbi:MBL fold metallo-hydrolase [Eubacteriales bacterium OttesenSCG-928-A19]|nr:MBL fold metallo-hydrolase [Eubacteriales bacterium OttesenSCG-928-A19]
MPFCFCPLRSGSSGNAIFVQAGAVRVLVDAGLSGRAVERALADIDAAPDSIQAILVTHEHSDHIAGVGVLSRRYDIPVYASEKTWLAMEDKASIRGIALKNRYAFTPNESFYIHDLAVSPFSTPHDAADPVGFALNFAGRKICVATDLGHVGGSLMQALSGSDLVLLEANHDPDLLRANQRYSARLKARILGKKGHLSNGDSGDALIRLVQEGLHHVILGHLSGDNNSPELAYNTVCTALQASGIRPGSDIQVDLAWREQTGGVYEID